MENLFWKIPLMFDLFLYMIIYKIVNFIKLRILKNIFKKNEIIHIIDIQKIKDFIISFDISDICNHNILDFVWSCDLHFFKILLESFQQ